VPHTTPALEPFGLPWPIVFGASLPRRAVKTILGGVVSEQKLKMSASSSSAEGASVGEKASAPYSKAQKGETDRQ
jgi:hypothetical protein